MSDVKQVYEKLLQKYLSQAAETVLYKGQKLSKQMIEQGVSPEEIVGFHIEAVKKLLPSLPLNMLHSLDFLLEVMMGYGFQYREHQNLREKQIQLQSEIEVAASIQQSLLPLVPQHIPEVDLGVLSVAANEMSGDYYHVVLDQNRQLGIGIADVIGKGIPAALCMSMIKFAIESLIEQSLDPKALLSSINRVVEKNVDVNMFITMIYGTYHLETHQFCYATAGHEPGLYYSAKHDQFYDMQVSGAVLGLSANSSYVNFQLQVEPGDMIILFSDGITETKKKDRFIERDEIISLFSRYKTCNAQEIAEQVHQELLKLSDFELGDDQTIVLIKRTFNP